MAKIFISHSSRDDTFVRDLRVALADHGLDGWSDLPELMFGDTIWPELQKAIEAASAFVIVVSAHALQSNWVVKELRHALALREQRGTFPIVVFSLNATTLGVWEEFFDEEPDYICVSSDARGIEAAINALLVEVGVLEFKTQAPLLSCDSSVLP